MALSPRKIGEGLYQPLAEINVTPLVDVMLVLLIIFMVTAPMLATGVRVNLPSAATAEPLETKDPVIVSVARDGSLSVGKDTIVPEALVSAVKAKLGGSNGVVQLRGDRDTAYGDVVSCWTRWRQTASPASPSSPARTKPRRSRRRPHDSDDG